MHATHSKTHAHRVASKPGKTPSKVAMWGGPKTTHIYIQVPSIIKNQPSVLSTINIPSSENDQIRIVLPKQIFKEAI